MYYGYSIASGKEKNNYIRGGEYIGVNSPAETVSNQTGNFTVMRIHSESCRILEIDDLLSAVNEEYIALTQSIITASDAVKEYLRVRISELLRKLEDLEAERRMLLTAAS